MKFIFLFIPKPETYEDGKLARLGLVIYWMGIALAFTCVFAEINESSSEGEFLLSGMVLFLICRAVLFILVDR